MTVYLGSQNVGVGMVEMIPADVNNQDIIITENGVYNAGEGYTGLGIVTVDVESSGGGEIIEVLNKTGAVINQGDKVWLSENTQVAGSSYRISTSTTISSSSDLRTTGVLSRSGNFMWFKNSMYSLDSSSATNIGSFSASINFLKYGPNQSIFGIYNKTTYRIDEGNQYKINYEYIGEDMFLGTDGVYYFDIDSGSQTQFRAYGFGSLASAEIAINGMIYRLASYSGYYLKGIYDGSNWNFTKVNVTNLESLKPLGATLDKKYIICSTSANSFVGSSGLRIVEIIDEDNMKVLTQAEMPTDLQPFYSTQGFYVFNPYTGVLTTAIAKTKDYAIMKYENNEWKKIPTDLSLTGDNTVKSAITVSDDLSRASFIRDTSGKSAPVYQYIINLTDVDGYSIIPYKPYTVNEKTITATALAESQPNEHTQVQIGSVTTEDLIITENGTYTPSATYTGFGSVTVNIETKPSEENVGDEIEVINNTGKTIEAGDKVWVNSIVGNTDGSLAKTGYYLQQCAMGFTKDGQYLFTGGRLNKVNKDNTLTELRNYNVTNDCRIKHFNGKTYAISLQFTTCLDYPNNWNVDWTLINDGYFVHAQNSSIRKYDLETGSLLKEYTGNADQYDDGEMIVIDNVMYRLNYKRRKYVFNDDDNTYSYYDYAATVNGGSVGHILGRTADDKYFIDDNLSLIKYLGNDTFEVVAYEKMPALLQRWNGMNKNVSFNQDTGILVVDAETEYGIYKYDNGEWYKLNFELNRTIDDHMKGYMVVDYDLTKYAFLTSNLNSYRVNVGTMQPNLKLMAQEFKWFNIDGQSITGIAKTSAEPGQELTVSTILEPKIDVSVTTNADNVDIIME